MTSSPRVHPARYCGSCPVLDMPARVLSHTGRYKRVQYIGSEKGAVSPLYGDSGVTKSRTTSASNVAFARTSRAVRVRALPSRMARSCLCDDFVNMIRPSQKMNRTYDCSLLAVFAKSGVCGPPLSPSSLGRQKLVCRLGRTCETLP